jgi:hypothetical protein
VLLALAAALVVQAGVRDGADDEGREDVEHAGDVFERDWGGELGAVGRDVAGLVDLVKSYIIFENQRELVLLQSKERLTGCLFGAARLSELRQEVV